ncbi:MAG: hypothetical protein PHG08_00220 [Bacilli bacterium]|nr:hypothetical protein [Bacilli bacterium]
MMKKCSKCGVEKELTEFSKNQYTKDGFKPHCILCIKRYKKEYYKTNKESIIEQQKEYYKNNKEYKKEYKKEYYKTNKEKIKTYREENFEYISKQHKEYTKQRRKDDPLFKLACNIRSLIGFSIRKSGYSKSSKTSAILGCSFEEFFNHIEKQFKEGMNWDNRHLWHLDHIYPVSLAVDEEHLLQLNHYTNFQPLWAEDNIRKGNKIF